MALVSFLAARWAVRRFAVPPAIADRLGMALVGLGLLMLTEEVLTRLMRGVSIFEHWAGFTPIANVINAAGLAVFLFMPLLVLRSRRASR